MRFSQIYRGNTVISCRDIANYMLRPQLKFRVVDLVLLGDMINIFLGQIFNTMRLCNLSSQWRTARTWEYQNGQSRLFSPAKSSVHVVQPRGLDF